MQVLIILFPHFTHFNRFSLKSKFYQTLPNKNSFKPKPNLLKPSQTNLTLTATNSNHTSIITIT